MAQGVVVPRVRGLTEPEARRVVERAGLVLLAGEPVPCRVPQPDRIVVQRPDSGARVAPRDTVRVAFCTAPEQPPAEVTSAPDLVGLGLAEAVAASGRARVKLQVNDLPNPLDTRYRVARQEPPPGTRLPLGSDVTAWFEAVGVRVPPVEGQLFDDAARTLARAGLGVGEVTRREADRPEGTVLRQAPRAGSTVDAGTGVDLLVAVRPRPRLVEVPDLGGRSLEAAERMLAGARLALGDARRVERPEPAGTVIGQRPPAGDSVPPGTAVQVAVSTGPPQTVVVPDLAGLLEEDAVRAIEGRRLAAGERRRQPAPGAEGRVVDQRPARGTRVPPGTEVSLVVGSRVAPPERVAVPGLFGRTREQAAARLQRVGLTLGRVTLRESEDPQATVIDQAPDVGTMVPPGSAVDVVIAEPIPIEAEPPETTPPTRTDTVRPPDSTPATLPPSPPPPPPAPFPWLPALGGALLLAGVLALALRARRGGQRRREARLEAVRVVPGEAVSHGEARFEEPAVAWTLRVAPGAPDTNVTLLPDGDTLLSEDDHD